MSNACLVRSAELESEKRLSSQKLDTLQRMVSSLVQQASQLKEDINTGEQFATCFTMRSLADHADEETDFRQDAEQRQRTAELVSQRARETHDALSLLGDRRALAAIREELSSDSEPHLAMYERSCGVILELVSQALDLEGQAADEPRGDETEQTAATAAAAAAAGTAPQALESSLGERIHGACRAHVARDEDGSVKLADLASAQVGRLSGLATRPRLYLQVEDELAAAAAAAAAPGDADGGQEERDLWREDESAACDPGSADQRRTADQGELLEETGGAMQVDCEWERHAS